MIEYMYTAKQVDNMVAEWKNAGLSKPDIVVKTANACIGWAYVFGARGEYCSPANRRRFYNSKGKPTIKSKCKNFDSTSGYTGCSGCKWYPGGATRFFDCRGFTAWLFDQVGIKIAGVGATSQYNDDTNWEVKGLIEDMPADKVCCTFRYDDSTKKMEHTLLYDGGGNYIHDSSEVKKTKKPSYKATHYAIPKGLYSSEEIDAPSQPVVIPPTDTSITLPTLRKGSKGSYVTLLQTLLMNRGYSLPKYGADGDFGNETLAAVKKFQADHELTADGVVGPKTWEALESNVETKKLYTVHIPNLSEDQAKQLSVQYAGSWISEE